MLAPQFNRFPGRQRYAGSLANLRGPVNSKVGLITHQPRQGAEEELHIEAEPLLIVGYEEMNPPPTSANRKQEALERIIDLYEAWDAAEPGKGYAEKAAQWRAKLGPDAEESETSPP